MRKGMFIIPFFATAACAVGFLAYSPSAAAAIDGENGPIVYIDNQVPTENENSVRATTNIHAQKLVLFDFIMCLLKVDK